MTSPARALDNPVMLEVLDLHKSYPGVRALGGVSLTLRAGEIHAVVGENGAGKSTLIRVLSGQERPDAGEVTIGGQPASFHGLRAARRAGISVVPQELVQVPNLSAGQNVLLGQEASFFSRRRRLSAADAERASSALVSVGGETAVHVRGERLTPAEIRFCQIAQTLASPGRVVILDEPTAVLSEPDAEKLLRRLVELKGTGRAILYVSHRLTEILRTVDRVSVLRDGRLVGTFNAADIDRRTLLRLMARVEGADRHEPKLSSTGVPRVGSLTLRRLRGERHQALSLTARSGEILGLAGVQGSGHGDVLRTLAGVSRPLDGQVLLDGNVLDLSSVAAAYRAGVVLIPADRKRAAVFAECSVRDNIVVGAGSTTHRFGLRRRGVEQRIAAELVGALGIRTRSTATKVGTLSGGNQQKVALARLMHSAGRVILVEEPTQGVDVESKAEIHSLLRALADEGRIVVIASSEFEELLDHADRIVVMRLGAAVAEYRADEARYETLLHDAIP